jgi:hypothetical protein
MIIMYLGRYLCLNVGTTFFQHSESDPYFKVSHRLQGSGSSRDLKNPRSRDKVLAGLLPRTSFPTPGSQIHRNNNNLPSTVTASAISLSY